MKGEVIYLYAYDIAYEANLAEIEKKMLGAAERFQIGRLKDAPREFLVYRSLSVQMRGDQKLHALDGLYTMLQQDSTNRVMLVLEISIVALFVIDLIIIVVMGVK
ncbi:MAG: hypothetical protein A2107_10600 [Verrucomicrobia bacterium GWF2_62_7]|nr:MAG: hypothetical protein A2107_10600 [Verrucomicrobia bacterium GWF2_62_7]